jgi:hypothetical protein
MNLLTRTLLSAAVLMTAFTLAAQDRRYAVVDYMHIPEDQSEEAYIATEKLWQRLHQKAVDAGICRSWYLEKVENGGRAHYVTIRIYDSLEKVASPWSSEMMSGLYNAEEEKTMNGTEKTRDLIRSELWQLEASALPDAGGDTSSYVFVHFMKPKPGKGEEYYNAEKNTWAKIHNARIKAGEMRNWHFASRMFPNGTDSEYDFITINVYSSKEPVWNSKTVETALGKEADKLRNPAEIRTTVREEIWKPILATKPKKS